MFPRHKYKTEIQNPWSLVKDPVGTVKHDGSHFFLNVESDGTLKYYSRNKSVKGHYPERSIQLPQLTAKKLPELAGHTYSVELVHTGPTKEGKERHTVVSGILNSLPPLSIETQRKVGPIRAVLIDVVNPPLTTYTEKLLHMKEVELLYGRPDVLYRTTPHIGLPAVVKLKESTKNQGQEGIIVTSLSVPESTNPRVKVLHKLRYNLRIVKILQEFDIHGNPKQSMGAAECEDSTGRIVATVGTGWDKNTREQAWFRPELWKGKLIQVETKGVSIDNGKLRSPVYNGDADGEIDKVQ